MAPNVGRERWKGVLEKVEFQPYFLNFENSFGLGFSAKIWLVSSAKALPT